MRMKSEIHFFLAEFTLERLCQSEHSEFARVSPFYSHGLTNNSFKKKKMRIAIESDDQGICVFPFDRIRELDQLSVNKNVFFFPAATKLSQFSCHFFRDMDSAMFIPEIVSNQ